jgi:circadian clock protein KaiC
MERLASGNPPLDLVMGGGFPRHSVNIVMGLPGSGKTILAQQIAFANGTAERPALYLTTISEPLPKVLGYLQELTFADVDRIGTEVIYESLGEALRDGLQGLVEHVTRLIETHRPRVLVVDSFKAIMELAAEPVAWRNSVFDLASLLAAYDVTAFLVGEYDHSMIARLPEFAVADGILELRRVQSGSRDTRFLHVVKLRGSDFRDGEHAFTISKSGVQVYPRLVGPAVAPTYRPVEERLQTGIAGLDAMIESGWLRGTSTVVAGPSGAGKTMLGLHFLRHGAEQGEPGLLVNFQESPTQLARAMVSLGWDLEALRRPDRLDVLYTSPVELQMDTIVEKLLERVEANGVRRVVIDALGDLARSATDDRRFSDYIYALTQEFAARKVTSLFLLEASGDVHAGHLETGRSVSYMSDNILVLSVDLERELRRTIRILKTRGSAHDGGRHVMHIGPHGMQVE